MPTVVQSSMSVVITGSGAGVTKAPFTDLPTTEIFDITKSGIEIFECHSYLTGVTAAELR